MTICDHCHRTSVQTETSVITYKVNLGRSGPIGPVFQGGEVDLCYDCASALSKNVNSLVSDFKKDH